MPLNGTRYQIFPHKYLQENGWDAKKHGLPSDFQKLRIYTSEISHFSFDKGAHIAGLGYEAVSKLPVDDLCRIDIKKAEEIIRMNRRGEKPESLKTEPEPAGLEFVTAVGDDSITRFDDNRKRKRKNRTNRQERQNRPQKPKKNGQNS